MIGALIGGSWLDGLIDILFVRSWWSWQPARPTLHSVAYHWFNLAEGVTWVVLGALELRRFLRQGRSRLEVWYAICFVAFGLTDFREAWLLQSWLIWVKLVNLTALVWLRAIVIRRFHPRAKLY